MSERTFEYLPVKVEDGRIGFQRTHILDLTQKDKQYIEALEKLKARPDITKPSQDPEVATLVKAYVSDDPSDWFAVEGTQLHEA